MSDVVKQHDTNYISVFALAHFHENPYQGPHERWLYEVKIRQGSAVSLGGRRCAIGLHHQDRPPLLHPLTKFFDKGIVDLTHCSILAGARFNIDSKLFVLRGHRDTSISPVPTPSDLLRDILSTQRLSHSITSRAPKE